METKKVRRLAVINGKKRMIGMLSLGDVYHTGSRHLGSEVMHAVSAHGMDHYIDIGAVDAVEGEKLTLKKTAEETVRTWH